MPTEICKRTAEHKRIKLICQTCGKESEVSPSSKSQKYCSPECYWISLKGRKQSKETKIKRGEAMKEIWQNPKFKEKMIRIHTSPKVSERHRKAAIQEWQDPEYRKKNKTNKGIKFSLESRKKLIEKLYIRWSSLEARIKQSKIMKLVSNSPEMKIKRSRIMRRLWQDPESIFNTPEHREKLSIGNQGQKRSKETRKKISIIVREQWQDSDYKEKQIKAIFRGQNKQPNNLEKFFNDLTPDCIRYTGNGTYFIRCKIKTHVPDFKIKGQKKIIELFGNYWHKDKELNALVKEYNEVGWRCLIFWENEIYNEPERILKKTLEFINL